MNGAEYVSPEACPLCSDVARRLRLSVASCVVNAPPYVQCQRCGLVFHHEPRPRPDPPLSWESFDRYTRWKLPTNRVRLNWLAQYASVPRGRAVDIGTKDGSAVKVLTEMGWQAVGYDPDQRFHAFAKETYGVEIRPDWFTADAVGPGTLDLVIAYHVFEHIPDPLPWLFEVWKALKPDGLLQIDTPNLGNIHATQICQGHAVLYTSHTLRQMLEKAGFRILAMTECAPGSNRTYDQLGVVAQRSQPKSVSFSVSHVDRVASSLLASPVEHFPPSPILSVRIYRAVTRRMVGAVRRFRYRALSRKNPSA